MFSFIIPSYNGKKLLEDCLKSLKLKAQSSKLKMKNEKCQMLNLEIIVVDNGSSDGSREYLESLSRHPEFISGSILKQVQDDSLKLKVVFNKKNLGFAEAVNQGIAKAKYPYLVVMNNDLKLKKDWLEEINRSIKKWEKKEKVGAYFGQVLDWEGKKIESTGLVYFPSGKALNRDNGEIFKKDKYDREEVIWGGSASVIVYSKKALKRIGLFDPLFFAYLEDVDLSLRLNAFGFKTIFVPKAISYHRGGGTADKMGNLRYRLVARNWWFIILKHYSLSYLFKHWPKIIFEQSKNFVKAGSLGGMFWVIKELVLKCPTIIRKRKPILF